MKALEKQRDDKSTLRQASPSARLLCAISGRDRKLFLGCHEQRLESLPVETIGVEDPETIDAAALQEIRPEIILTGWSSRPLPPDWLASSDCPLRYVCHLAGSVKALVPRQFIGRGGLVSNWGELAADSVAEHGLLLALAALRNLAGWEAAIEQCGGRHSIALRTRTLFHQPVGIHGFGAVARSLIKLLRPFGSQIRVYSAGVPEATILKEGVEACDSLEGLFAKSHVLFECEGLISKSENSVRAEILAALPDGAVFVNIARGRLVDEAALLREAAQGRIRIALDVVRDEPLTKDSPLYQVPGAIFSPHIGGPTSDLYPRFGNFALNNIERYLYGEKPLALVTPEIYDRST